MKITKLIYSFLHPEVRKLQEKLWDEKPHFLFDQSYLKNQEFKECEFIDVWKTWTQSVLNHNPKLAYFYPTNGSSEAIREVIYQIKNRNRKMVVLENDYEGYIAFANACQLSYKIIKRSEILDYEFSSNETLILSHPSSIDGCIYEDYDSLMKRIDSMFPLVEVYLDLCYVGTIAKEYQIELNYNCIQGYFMSLSKVFGVYYHRIGGLVSKKEELGLFGNQWFKNMFSLEFGLRLMAQFSIYELPRKIENHQLEIIKEINDEFSYNIIPCDVVILAKSNDVIAEFARGSISRICLTPALDEKTRGKT